MDFIVNDLNFMTESFKITQEIQKIVMSGGQAKVEVKKKSTRSLSMNALWWMWMGQTAAWMGKQGVTYQLTNSKGVVIFERPLTPKDAHDMFVEHWLGVDENGKRAETKKMQKDRFLYLMDKHSEWAVRKGLILTYPSDCEYSKLKAKTEA